MNIKVSQYRKEITSSFFNWATALLMLSLLPALFLVGCAENLNRQGSDAASTDFVDLNDLVNGLFQEKRYLNSVSFSSDGSLLAAMGSWRPDVDPGGQLYVFDLDQHQVVFDRGRVEGWWSLTMSPTGDQVAVAGQSSLGDGIHLIDIENNAVELLTKGRNPAWSPDGKKLAFVYDTIVHSDPERRIQIHILDLANNDASIIFDIQSSRGYIGNLIWSPENDRLVFLGNLERLYNRNNLYTIKVDGSDLQMITSERINISSPSFSPDGKKILYIDDTNSYYNGIFLQVSDLSGDCHRLDYPASDIRNITLSPDGEKVILGTQHEFLLGDTKNVLGEDFWDTGTACAK